VAVAKSAAPAINADANLRIEETMVNPLFGLGLAQVYPALN
jgi:hypothetical protein